MVRKSVLACAFLWLGVSALGGQGPAPAPQAGSPALPVLTPLPTVAGPALTPDQSVPLAQGLAIVRATTDGSVRWEVSGATGTVPSGGDGKTLVVVLIQAGTVTVSCQAVINGTVSAPTKTTITVTANGSVAKPTGRPPVRPPVNPQPQKPAAKAFITFFVDPSDKSPGMRALADKDGAFQAGLAAKGLDPLVRKTDEVTAELKKWIQDAGGPPLMVFHDEQNQPLSKPVKLNATTPVDDALKAADEFLRAPKAQPKEGEVYWQDGVRYRVVSVRDLSQVPADDMVVLGGRLFRMVTVRKESEVVATKGGQP
jgi:hypothetical protein